MGDHTPIPGDWKVDGRHIWVAQGSLDRLIATTATYVLEGRDRAEDNAGFIARACNNHDPLVAACAIAHGLLSTMCDREDVEVKDGLRQLQDAFVAATENVGDHTPTPIDRPGCFGCKFSQPLYRWYGVKMIVYCAKLGLDGTPEKVTGECDISERP